MKSKKRIWIWSLAIILFAFIVSGTILMYVNSFSKYYVTVKTAPKVETILVLGAGVVNGKPSLALSDRLDNAVELYKASKSKRILVSGDNGTTYYDEVTAMKNYLVKKDVKKGAIFGDYAGFNTYDSMYRAKEIFGIKTMIIATNEFHMQRSLYIARRLGIEAYGYPTIDKIKIYDVWGTLLEREFLAKYKAFLDVEILHRTPKFLGPKVNMLY